MAARTEHFAGGSAKPPATGHVNRTDESLRSKIDAICPCKGAGCANPLHVLALKVEELTIAAARDHDDDCARIFTAHDMANERVLTLERRIKELESLLASRGPVPKRHVFVAIPFVGHWIAAGIARFAESCGFQNALNRDVRFTLKPLTGSTVISHPVEFMRNRLVKMALDDKTVTDLWFIDSDTMPSPNAMTLLDVEADIVAGVYKIPNSHDGYVWSAYEAKPGSPDKFRYINDLPREPFEAGGAGTGAMIIKRRVLEDPRLPFAPPEEGTPCLFRTTRRASGEMIGTDDLDFCGRARALGYRLIVDPRVKFGHVKTRLYA